MGSAMPAFDREREEGATGAPQMVFSDEPEDDDSLFKDALPQLAMPVRKKQKSTKGFLTVEQLQAFFTL